MPSILSLLVGSRLIHPDDLINGISSHPCSKVSAQLFIFQELLNLGEICLRVLVEEVSHSFDSICKYCRWSPQLPCRGRTDCTEGFIVQAKLIYPLMANSERNSDLKRWYASCNSILDLFAEDLGEALTRHLKTPRYLYRSVIRTKSTALDKNICKRVAHWTPAPVLV